MRILYAKAERGDPAMNQAKPIYRFLTLPTLVGGGVVLAAALLTRLTVGNPLMILHKLGALGNLPPLWLLGFIWLTLYLLVGASTGYLLSCPSGKNGREASLWRGCTFMVLAVVLSLVWFTLLFGKFWLLPSWLCLCLAFVCAAICAVSWWQVGKGPAIIIWLFAIWQICLFFLQFAIMLST